MPSYALAETQVGSDSSDSSEINDSGDSSDISRGSYRINGNDSTLPMHGIFEVGDFKKSSNLIKFYRYSN